MTIWHWLAALVVVILFCGTRGAARGGIVILTLVFFVGRVVYLWSISGQ